MSERQAAADRLAERLREFHAELPEEEAALLEEILALASGQREVSGHMVGDITRFVFRPQKSYSGVRLQQGRVVVDADWNA